MPAVRLSVCLPDEAGPARLAARLHDAIIQTHAPSTACDAVLLAGLGPDPAALLTAGTPVLVLAEPCPSAQQIAEWYALAREKAVPFAVVNPERHLPSRQLIRHHLSGPLGEPGLLRLHRWGPPTVPADGLLRDLDVTLWLMARRPGRVHALERCEDGTPGRYHQVHLGFAGGMALLDHTDRLPAGDSYTSLSVIAANGAAYVDDHQNVQLVYRGGAARALRTEERAGVLAAIAQEFIAGLRTGRDPWPDGAAEWQAVFAVAEAVQRSIAGQEAVTLEGPP